MQHVKYEGDYGDIKSVMAFVDAVQAFIDAVQAKMGV